MENVKIRNATLEDIKQIARLHIDSWHETYSGIISQEHLDNMKNNLENRIEKMKKEFNLRTKIVITLNDEIVGFADFVSSNKFSKDLNIDCEICGLYIKNGYKHLGLGSMIFEYITNIFKENNKKKMGIWCLKENLPAISFYKKKGGTITTEKSITIGNLEYTEVAFLYNL